MKSECSASAVQWRLSRDRAPTLASSRWPVASNQISRNSALFSLLGTTYGGDGVSTFALPDLQGRVPIHEGTGPGLPKSLGQKSGSETVMITLQQTNLPDVIPATATIEGMVTASLVSGAVSGSFDSSGDHFHTVNDHTHPFTYGSFTFPDASAASVTMDIDNVQVEGSTRGLRGLKEKKNQAEAHKVRRLGMPQDNAANIEVLQTQVDGIIAAGTVGPQGKLFIPYLITATSYLIHASHSHP